MANRTFRRANNRSEGSETSSTDNDGRSHVAIEGSNGATESDESAIDGHGVNNESEFDDDNQRIGVVEIDPSELGEYIERDSRGSSDGEPRKRRGRRKGSKNGSNKKAETTVEPFLMMAHTWASVLLKTPEIALTADEAKQLSDSYSVFCEHHDVPVISAKRMSEINLIASMFMVYGPRFVAVRNRHKQERAVKAAKNVTNYGPQVVAN